MLEHEEKVTNGERAGIAFLLLFCLSPAIALVIMVVKYVINL